MSSSPHHLPEASSVTSHLGFGTLRAGGAESVSSSFPCVFRVYLCVFALTMGDQGQQEAAAAAAAALAAAVPVSFAPPPIPHEQNSDDEEQAQPPQDADPRDNFRPALRAGDADADRDIICACSPPLDAHRTNLCVSTSASPLCDLVLRGLASGPSREL